MLAKANVVVVADVVAVEGRSVGGDGAAVAGGTVTGDVRRGVTCDYFEGDMYIVFSL